MMFPTHSYIFFLCGLVRTKKLTVLLRFNYLLTGFEFSFVFILRVCTKVTEQISPTPVFGFVLIALVTLPMGGIYLC